MYCYRSGGACDLIKKANEPCTKGVVCEEGLVCASNVCVKAPGLDEPCEGECDVGLFCSLDAKCVLERVVGEGAECGGATVCSPETECVSPDGMSPSKCVKRTFNGEGMDCSGTCGPGLFCRSGKCEKLSQPACR